MIKRKETTVGFFISEQRITVVECLINKQVITVLKSVHAEVPSGYVHKGEITDFDSLLAFTSDVVDQIAPQTKYASVNIPPGTYILKRMPLPEEYISRDPDLIKWEMRHHLISSADDYTYSHFHSNGHSYFIAVLKSVLDQRTELLQGLGFVAMAAEPSPISLNNLYSFIEDSKKTDTNAVLFELSSPYSSLGLIVNGSFMPGGSFATDPGICLSAFNEGQVPNRLSSFKSDLSVHFEMVFGSLGYKIDDMNFDTLIFSGGKPSSQVAIQLEQLFNCSIFLADMPKKNRKIAFKGKLNNLSFSEIATSIGLALRTKSD